MFQSVLRFQRLLKTARETGATQTLADLAASAGYADQAHMTRDVHRLANTRPTVLLRSAESTLQMSDLFKSGTALPELSVLDGLRRRASLPGMVAAAAKFHASEEEMPCKDWKKSGFSSSRVLAHCFCDVDMEPETLREGLLTFPSRRRLGGDLHTDGLQGGKMFALWPLSPAAASVRGAARGRRPSFASTLGWSLMWIASRTPQRSLSPWVIKCFSRTRRNRGRR